MIASKNYWIVLLAAFAVACGESNGDDGKDPGKGEEGEYVPYDPPTEVNSNNVFKVGVFSTLGDEALFGTRDQTVVADFMNAYSGQKPLIYLLERSDFKAGNMLPHVDIGFKSKSYSFFAQQSNTADEVKGTGLVTRYVVNNYDGVMQDGMCMSGCQLTAPLVKPVDVIVYTSRIDQLEQMKTMIAQRGSVLQYNGIVVGSMKNDAVETVAAYLKNNFKNYRIEFTHSTATEYDLFVLTPVDYVCRQIEQGEKVNFTYYIVSVERLTGK